MRYAGLRSFGRFIVGIAVIACMAASPSPAAPTRPTLPPPPASAALGTPEGIIGPIERNRKSPPSALAKFVSSADPALAGRAVLGLGRLGNPAAIPMVVAALHDSTRPVQVRRMAAVALGLLRTRAVIP